MKNNLQSIIAKAKEITQSGLPFMEGREKGEMDRLVGEVYTIKEYGYLEGEDGEFVVFLVEEDKENFYFGGSVITDNMKKLDDVLKEDEIAELLETGITILCEKKKSKNKRDYVKCTFFPEN